MKALDFGSHICHIPRDLFFARISMIMLVIIDNNWMFAIFMTLYVFTKWQHTSVVTAVYYYLCGYCTFKCFVTLSASLRNILWKIGIIYIKILILVPHAPPVNLRGNYKNSTAIQLYWEPVPEEHQNGRISNYTVKYREKMANSGWKNLTVSSPNMQIIVCDLDFYTLYEFKIAASTSVGLGPFSNVTEIRTDADGAFLVA